MVNDYYNTSIDIYKIETNNKKIDKKKILLVVLCIVVLVEVFFAVRYSVKAIKSYKFYKQYETQLQSIKLQEEQQRKQLAEETERIKKERLPNLTEKGKENIGNIYHSDKKIAYLTFDDGPSIVTPTILDVLKQETVKATFFVLGSNVEKMPETTKRIYDEGHCIANHGYSHVYQTIYQSPQTVLDEYNMCNDIVKNAIGQQEYNSHLFRFPGGLPGGKYAEIKNQASELLSQNNIMHIDWNALTGDAETNNLSTEFELTRLEQTTTDKNSVVILMHDAPAKKVTADSLPQIISYLREQGYEFKSFYDIIK